MFLPLQEEHCFIAVSEWTIEELLVIRSRCTTCHSGNICEGMDLAIRRDIPEAFNQDSCGQEFTPGARIAPQPVTATLSADFASWYSLYGHDASYQEDSQDQPGKQSENRTDDAKDIAGLGGAVA